ncbi:MAG: DUF1109 domain-containing protein [Pseudomonadota bacterium]
MKTDDLIGLLAAGVPPVAPHAGARRAARALALSLPVAVALMLGVLGLNPALGEYLHLPMFWVKFIAPLCMAIAGTVLLGRLGRPGTPVRAGWLAWLLPVLLLWALGAVVWLDAPPEQRRALVMGQTWRYCPACIVMLSAPIFAAALWVLRGMAPVRPRLAGAGAGALAGAAGATVYALHCPELGAPFLAIWYVIGMAIPVAVGALVGPRLLRW